MNDTDPNVCPACGWIGWDCPCPPSPTPEDEDGWVRLDDDALYDVWRVIAGHVPVGIEP